jgi:60 kDa SS-A/Ro ribonucleoprotein
MLYAIEHKLDVDAFCIYTDSETWAGAMHPSQALRRYRVAQNKPHAAQVVVGMTATDITIADPKDPRTLDVVGFDMATPQAISEFLVATPPDAAITQLDA